MKAKEMFKELGFRREIHEAVYFGDMSLVHYIDYIKGGYTIEFEDNQRSIIIKGSSYRDGLVINSDVLKAIAKQCKELGWL